MPKPSLLLCLLLPSLSHAAGAQATAGVQASAGARPTGQVAAEALKPPPAWEAAVAQRRQELISRNGPGTEAGLRDRLLQMRKVDQDARGFMMGAANQGTQQQRIQHLSETDTQLTVELKSIVADKGWPTISLVGIDASDAAMLLLTHTADHVWQLQLLPQLEQLADNGKIDPSSLALVIDKQLVAAGKLQRYGTQFKFVDGRMAMYAVEDPGNLNTIRDRAMLPPMHFYKQLLGKMYGLKPTNDIVTATPPPSQASSPTSTP